MEMQSEMTEVQLHTLAAWLDAKWGDSAECPAGHSDWEASSALYRLPTYMPGQQAVVDGLTVVVIGCKECGYLALMNARQDGLA